VTINIDFFAFSAFIATMFAVLVLVEERKNITRSVIALWATAALIVAFQAQIVPLLGARTSVGAQWKLAYYGFWLMILCAVGANLRLSMLPTLAMCCALAALVIPYPMGPIAKNWIVAIGIIGCLAIAAPPAGMQRVLRISAATTAFIAAGCLVDALFQHGMTDTPGRAAGLNIAPNVAAISLLLGAAVSWPAVPSGLTIYFLLLAGFAIFTTLSKGTILAYLIIFSFVGWRYLRPMKAAGPLAFTVLLAAWIGAAWTVNPQFMTATRNSISNITNALPSLERAELAISSSQHQQAVAPKKPNEARIQAISKRAETEGDRNSLSARFLLLQRAWLLYEQKPWQGYGLDFAHKTAPHNAFLFFALAFGMIGWLIPLSFLWIVRNNLPLAACTVFAFATSHDFLVPALVVSIGLSIANEETHALSGLRPVDPGMDGVLDRVSSDPSDADRDGTIRLNNQAPR
jgi:hypothetical protein